MTHPPRLRIVMLITALLLPMTAQAIEAPTAEPPTTSGVTAAGPQVSTSTPAETPKIQARSPKQRGRAAFIANMQSRKPARQRAALRTAQTRLLRIKDGIYNAKKQLALLFQGRMTGKIPQSRATIVRRSALPAPFVLLRETYYLDGKLLYRNATVSAQASLELFAGRVAAGNHSLAVEQVWGLRSSVFGYLKGYEVKMRASYAFYVAKGQLTRVEALATSRGGVGTELLDKPTLKFVVRQIRR